jgi:hypothetical protein
MLWTCSEAFVFGSKLRRIARACGGPGVRELGWASKLLLILPVAGQQGCSLLDEQSLHVFMAVLVLWQQVVCAHQKRNLEGD